MLTNGFNIVFLQSPVAVVSGAVCDVREGSLKGWIVCEYCFAGRASRLREAGAKERPDYLSTFSLFH